MTQSITIVIPCYNETTVIEPLAAQLKAKLPPMMEKFDVRFSLLFVDDGSQDTTIQALEKASFPCPAEVVCFSRNFGKEAALTAGLEIAEGDAVILMDADLQHPPEKLADLIRGWREGHDMVYFYKQDRKGEGTGRGTAARVFYKLINHGSRVEVPPNSGDFRLLDRAVVDALRRLPERQRFMKGLYAWVGFRQKGLPLAIPERHDRGKSRFSLIRILDLALDGITSFSVAPIRLISIFGIVMATLSFVYMIWIVLERLIFGSPFSGFASLAVMLALFGGVQLLCIGLVGEYVGRSLQESKGRPTFIVREQRSLRGPAL